MEKLCFLLGVIRKWKSYDKIATIEIVYLIETYGNGTGKEEEIP